MVFKLVVPFEKRFINLLGEIIYTDKICEKIKISGRNRSIIIQSNRPIFLSGGLKHRKLDWKLIEGEMYSTHLFQVICQEVEKFLKTNIQ